jgi:hypothetical protein
LEKDPQYLEREYYSNRNKRYDDHIDVYNSMIEELELLYERVPPTQFQQHNRDRVQGGIKQLQMELADIQSEYDDFKQNKT